VPSTGPGPQVDVATPIFPDQIVGTISAAQRVTVTNTGDQPLHVGSLKIEDAEGASAGDFVVADESCTKTEIAPGASCAVLVRFAPARVKVTSHERLVIADDTADRSHTVDLTGTSVPAPTVGDQGDAGAAATSTRRTHRVSAGSFAFPDPSRHARRRRCENGLGGVRETGRPSTRR
jgi:urease beta subunit